MLLVLGRDRNQALKKHCLWYIIVMDSLERESGKGMTDLPMAANSQTRFCMVLIS